MGRSKSRNNIQASKALHHVPERNRNQKKKKKKKKKTSEEEEEVEEGQSIMFTLVMIFSLNLTIV